MEHYVFRFSLRFAIDQPYAVSHYTAWNILIQRELVEGFKEFENL